MGNSTDEESAKIDAPNRLRWRYAPRRLEAEAVRDATLSATGQLILDVHGPSVYPPIPKEILAGQSIPGLGWQKRGPADSKRRAMYIFVKRAVRPSEIDLLDFPDTTASCEQRLVSTIAPQALTLFNGGFMREQANAFAERIEREFGDDTTRQIEGAFKLAYCRSPASEETVAVQRFLTDECEHYAHEAKLDAKQARRKALADFCLVLLNSNEFLYVE